MNAMTNIQSTLALVDDDSHSARLMIRMLLAHGAPSVGWHESCESGVAEIGKLLADGSRLPGLVIVDVKASSTATNQCVARLRQLPGGDALVIAAMTPTLAREVREATLAAGADAVFERHSDINAYRKEAAAMVSFWVRNQRLDAVGT